MYDPLPPVTIAVQETCVPIGAVDGGDAISPITRRGGGPVTLKFVCPQASYTALEPAFRTHT